LKSVKCQYASYCVERDLKQHRIKNLQKERADVKFLISSLKYDRKTVLL
jgi:hypothetical protein